MKIILVNPPIEDFYITSVRRQPLGLLYIASTLKLYKHDVEILNCHTPKKHKLEIPNKFRYLNEFINHNNSLYRFPFGSYQRFGMSMQAIEDRIKKSKADLFLISSLFSTYHEEVEGIIEIIRKYHPQKIVAVGGYHPSLFPKKFIERTDVDAVVVGEGESGCLKLVAQIKNGEFKKGSIINGGEMEKNLDFIPFPDRSMLKDRDFNFYKKRGTPVIASRGCPNKCSFCTSRRFWDGHYAFRSTENVLNEITECVNRYGISQFNFEDDNLFVKRDRAIEFLEGLIKYQQNENLNLDLSAMNGVSIENLDRDVIVLMNKAGFKEINISLVTSSIKQQKSLGRPFSTTKFGEIVESAKLEAMNVRAYYILGLPNQEKGEVLDTIKYLKKLRIQSFPSVYYNITEKDEEWKVQRSSAFFNETKNLSREDLIYLFNYNYSGNNRL